MRIPALLALLLLAASAPAPAEDPVAPMPKVKFESGKEKGAAAGKPYDLTSLGVGRVVPGPSPGPGPSPSGAAASGGSDPVLKAVVLAAIKEYAEHNRAEAAAHFKQVFPTIPVHGGPDAAFHEGYIAFIGDMLRKMVEADKIRVLVISGKSASADWAPDVTKDADGREMMTGGEVRVSGMETAKAAGRNSSECKAVFGQDNFANSVLHEVGHMFYSAFVYGFEAKDKMANPSPRTSFFNSNYWKGGPLSYCRGESECRFCGIDQVTGKYKWKFEGAHASRGGATEWVARELAWKASEASGGAAYRRVLQPIF